MMREVMLTTTDNPFDPFDQMSEWFAHDLRTHNCSAYLDRVARTSTQLSEQENMKIIEQAIDEIITYDAANIYRKVVRETDYETLANVE